MNLRLLGLFLLLGLASCKNSPLETVETRDEDGNTIRQEQRKEDKVKEGLYQKIGRNGAVIVEAHYLNDSLHGERRFFYPDGSVESIETYQNGQYHGPYRKFYPGGKPWVEQTYEHGTMQGLSISYYPNGQISEKVTMVANEENGPFQEYYENGALKAEGTYVPNDGGSVEHGELKEYNEQGQLIRVADCVYGACKTRK